MPTPQERLDLYYAAEARILSAGFSVRYDVRQRQEAELAQIRKGIAQLEAQIGGGKGGAGRGSLRYRTAVFS